MASRCMYRIVPPDPLPEGAEGPKRFVKDRAEAYRFRGKIQKCASNNSAMVAVLRGPSADAFYSFQKLLRDRSFLVTEITELPEGSKDLEVPDDCPPGVTIVESPEHIRGDASSGHASAASVPSAVRDARRGAAAARTDAAVATRQRQAAEAHADHLTSLSEGLAREAAEAQAAQAAAERRARDAELEAVLATRRAQEEADRRIMDMLREQAGRAEAERKEQAERAEAERKQQAERAEAERKQQAAKLEKLYQDTLEKERERADKERERAENAEKKLAELKQQRGCAIM